MTQGCVSLLGTSMQAAAWSATTHPRRALHDAQSVLLHAKKKTEEHDRLRTWTLGRKRARGHNKGAVALANKLARIVWAVWRNGRAF